MGTRIVHFLSQRTDMSPSFTFAPLLAIALDRQALLVALHPDHAWPLSKLRHGGALSQDHVDLTSFHVQLSSLPDVDILHHQSRPAVSASISDGQEVSPTQPDARERALFLPRMLLSYLPCFPTCTARQHLRPRVFSFESVHYPPVKDALLLLIVWGNPPPFL